MHVIECKCGTLFHVKEPFKPFRCQKCSRKIVSANLDPQRQAEERLQQDNHSLRLSRWIFVLGSSVGLFLLFMMIPTSLLANPSIELLMLELFLGTILVCASLSFYLLSMQVQSMQHMMNLHMNNLRIFADQLSRLRTALRKKH